MVKRLFSNIAKGTLLLVLSGFWQIGVEAADVDALENLPGSSFQIPPGMGTADLVPDAPVITGWHRTLRSGESFTLTGARFTLSHGEDTTVWVWDGVGPAPLQTLIWEVSDAVLIGTLPEDLSAGVLWIWVENEAGAGIPVVVNRAEAHWIGPLGNRVEPGGETRVFGRNFSTGDDASALQVFLQAVGEEAMRQCDVIAVEPQAVGFRIPIYMHPGSYRVWVHNGTGGAWGWSNPLEVEVAAKHTPPTFRESVLPSGEDDTLVLRAAILRAAEQPGGGVVALGEGTFRVSANLRIPSGVTLTGAGREETRLEGKHPVVLESGSRLQDLSIPFLHFPPDCRDIEVEGVRIGLPVGPPRSSHFLENVRRVRISDSEFGHLVFAGGEDVWLAGNTITGVGYSEEAAIEFLHAPNGVRLVVEGNHFETVDWPVGPEGSRNYHDFLSREKLRDTPWVKRMFLALGGSLSHSYIARNTTKDVAVQDNKGEIILFHDTGASWIGGVVAAKGTELVLDTASSIHGKEMDLSPDHIETGGEVRVPRSPGQHSEVQYAVVVSGTGIGQKRRVLEHTAESVTLDRPWLVPPDADSVVVITPLYVDNVLYANQLAGFPEGYVQSNSASVGINLYGQAWGTSAEANESERTRGGPYLHGSPSRPAFWNEFRNEIVRSAAHYGILMKVAAHQRPLMPGVVTLGNAFRNCHIEIVGPSQLQHEALLWEIALMSIDFTHREQHGAPSDLPFAVQLGNIFENNRAEGSMQGIIYGRQVLSLFRNNHITLRDRETTLPMEQPQAVALRGKTYPLLAGNQFEGTEGQLFFPSMNYRSEAVVRPLVRRLLLRPGEPSAEALLANTGIEDQRVRLVDGAAWMNWETASLEIPAEETVVARVRIDPAAAPSPGEEGSFGVELNDQVFPVGWRVLDARGQSPGGLPEQFNPRLHLEADGILPETERMESAPKEVARIPLPSDPVLEMNFDEYEQGSMQSPANREQFARHGWSEGSQTLYSNMVISEDPLTGRNAMKLEGGESQFQWWKRSGAEHWEDYRVSLRFRLGDPEDWIRKFPGGTIFQDINVRAGHPREQYRRAYVSLALVETEDGPFFQFQIYPGTHPIIQKTTSVSVDGAWHEIVVEVEGNVLTVSLDGDSFAVPLVQTSVSGGIYFRGPQPRRSAETGVTPFPSVYFQDFSVQPIGLWHQN